MTILVSYDIESDPLRQKVANKLLEYGLIRLQKSVFAGSIGDASWRKLLDWIKKDALTKFTTGDQLLYLPLTDLQAAQFTFLPEPPPLWQETLDPPATLFI